MSLSLVAQMTLAFYQDEVQEVWSAGVDMLPGSLNQCREQCGGGKSAVCVCVCAVFDSFCNMTGSSCHIWSD